MFKKILFATTALVATAGVAAAEVAVSGSAEIGVIDGVRPIKVGQKPMEAECDLVRSGQRRTQADVARCGAGDAQCIEHQLVLQILHGEAAQPRKVVHELRGGGAVCSTAVGEPQDELGQGHQAPPAV